jgi:hypothetical protein
MTATRGAMRKRWWLAAAGLCVIAGAWRDANAQATPGAPIPVELNRLQSLPAAGGSPGGAESSGSGCRIYIVVTNPDPKPISQLRLDVMMFNTDGIVSRRVDLELGPLTAHKTMVRLFDIQDQPCDGIGRLLVNDVFCSAGPSTDPNQQRQACLDRLQLSSRAKAELTK